MTLRLATPATLLALACFALPAAAQDIRPGLWEMNNKVGSDNPQMAQAMAAMQKQLASMPAEQRKAMEEMMSKHGGVQLESTKDGSMLVKMCLTKDVIKDAMFGTQPQMGNCSMNKTPMVGSTMSYTFNCTNPASSGQGQITFSGDTAYQSRATVLSTQDGKKQTMTMDSRARWLGADCGTIKPLNIKPQAPAGK